MTTFLAWRHLLLLLLTSLAITGGCKSKTDPKPAQISDRDVLMQADGHWEWESSARMMSQLTPASIGFSRQLIFKPDGLVHIYHNRQPFIQPVYQLSYGVLSQCGASPQPISVPFVRYAAEPQIPNNDLRTYSIRLSPTDTTLYITGESACIDGGAYETYRWHRH